MPSSNVSTSVGTAAPGRNSISAASGDSSVSGNPITSQCASTFASTPTNNGSTFNTSCSSVPSSKSRRNSESSDNSVDSNASTHSTPGAISASRSAPGPTPSGNIEMPIA